MISDGIPLREVTEADLRGLIAAGSAEHIRLEYKSELYENTDRGNREFLLDICMFANSQGGLLLLGIPELRDADGQPTGAPDPAMPVGLEIQNAEATLVAYAARIEACIEESLRVESHAIPVAPNRFVLAFRVPRSLGRPHTVRYQAHTYFPCRRERHRGRLDVTEIKEMVMQLASQLDKASTLLETELLTVPRPANEATLAIGLLPIYFREFGTDIGTVQIAQAFARFDVRTRNAGYLAPTYAYQGLMRQAVRDTSILGRNGFIRSRLDLARRRDPARAVQAFHVTAVDVFLRNFILRAREFNRLVMLDSPFLFRASLITPEAICGIGEVNEEYGEVPAGRYDFGTLQISNLDVPFEQIIKPFCDQAHQMFGDQVSPCFDQDNHWRVQYG